MLLGVILFAFPIFTFPSFSCFSIYLMFGGFFLLIIPLLYGTVRATLFPVKCPKCNHRMEVSPIERKVCCNSLGSNNGYWPTHCSHCGFIPTDRVCSQESIYGKLHTRYRKMQKTLTVAKYALFTMLILVLSLSLIFFIRVFHWTDVMLSLNYLVVYPIKVLILFGLLFVVICRFFYFFCPYCGQRFGFYKYFECPYCHKKL